MSRSGPPPLDRDAGIAAGYTVIEHLSRGRTLDVYDAWSVSRGARCIVKTLRPDRIDDGTAARRLIAEGRLIQRLAHPHIVRGYETVREPRIAVIMETLTGVTLARLIDDAQRRMAVRDIAHLGLHLGSAIRYLHGVGWLHLLKPSNVVAEAGRAKLIDMSVARRPGPSWGGVGTWCYMAPEQVRGGVLGPAADVWGLGAVLYEATAGQAPFDPDPVTSAATPEADESHDEEAGRHHRQLDGPPAPIGHLRRAPQVLVEVIDACLAPDAERRPSVEDVMARLEPLAGLPPGERRWSGRDAYATNREPTPRTVSMRTSPTFLRR